jgi:CRP-like cAMP-binding protein
VAGVRQATKSLAAAHYPEIASDLLEALLRMLQAARIHCGGDIDKFLVMMVIGLRTTSHPSFRDRPADEPPAAPGELLPSLGVNGQSVADSLGIPKETVRRKIHELMDAGWVVRHDGLLFFTTEAYAAMEPLRDEMIALAACHHEVIERLRQLG